jgi:hypothetical protein
MIDFRLDEYLRLKTFEERKAYCLTHEVKQRIQVRPIDDLDWDYEKQNSYSNYELSE